MSRASAKALERLDAAIRHYGPQFLSKADMRALQRLAKRTEAAERAAEGLRRRISVACSYIGGVHTGSFVNGALVLAAWRTLDLSKPSPEAEPLAPRTTKDAARGAGRKKRRRGTSEGA